MRYNQLRSAMLTQFAAKNGNKVAYFILGAPGGGKSALARDVAYTHLRKLGIEPVNNVNVIEFNASLRDPVDILGTPKNDNGVTDWIPPREFYQLRKGVGPCVLILEELSDATMAMQNPLCRVIYDRFAGQLELSEDLYIIATGNRTQDKSGANRISTKLGNRVRMHEFHENLDDWIRWAMNHDIDPMICQFVRFRPNLLSNFDPTRLSNPTPRSWEDVNRIDRSQTADVFMAEVAAAVGEGAAAEYVAFRRVADSLISPEEVVKDPKKAPLPGPDKLDAQFAMVGSLAAFVTPKTVGPVSEYIARMTVDFQTMFWMDAMKRSPKINSSKEFIDWLSKNSNVLVNEA